MQLDATFEQKVAEVLDLSYGTDSTNRDVPRAVAELRELSSYPVTIALLSQTGAGTQLANLSKEHPDSELKKAASATSSAWRNTLTTGQLGSYLQQRGNVSVPSSSCAGLLSMFADRS